jgi:uncharacterized membrane protein YdbT with pleckstrin-like domain
VVDCRTKHIPTLNAKSGANSSTIPATESLKVAGTCWDVVLVIIVALIVRSDIDHINDDNHHES